MSIRVVRDLVAVRPKDETMARASVWTHSCAYDWAMRNPDYLPAMTTEQQRSKKRQNKERRDWFWVFVIFIVVPFLLFLWDTNKDKSTPSEYRPNCYQEFGGSNGWVCD